MSAEVNYPDLVPVRLSSSEQARRDAQLDAGVVMLARKDWTCVFLGRGASHMIRLGLEVDQYGNTADRLARFAARAAFRAVPALRGPDYSAACSRWGFDPETRCVHPVHGHSGPCFDAAGNTTLTLRDQILRSA